MRSKSEPEFHDLRVSRCGHDSQTAPRTGLLRWYWIRYHESMRADRAILSSRRRSGLTLRQLGERAATSHATISAYERRRAQPSVETANRIIGAAGLVLESTLVRRISANDTERGAELVDALELAAAFPARHSPRLRYPRFADIAVERP